MMIIQLMLARGTILDLHCRGVSPNFNNLSPQDCLEEPVYLTPVYNLDPY